MPAWLTYALLRIGVFAVVFAVLLVVGLGWFWAAVLATVVAFCVSFVLFRRQRDAVASEWAGRRRPRNADELDEDAEAHIAEGDRSARADSPAGGEGSAGGEGERRAEADAERERREGRQP